jgi:hypothetical protein
MSKKLRLINKILSSFVAFLLVFQSFSVYFLAQPRSVYAEDATPTPIETTTPAPEDTSTPAPIETPSIEPLHQK